MRRLVASLLGASLAVSAPLASAAPPEPTGPHPRMFLDTKTKSAIKAAASKEGSHISRAIRECRRATASMKEEARNAYMGFNWASNTTNCALAWHATGDASHAKTAIHFFTALLDDWDTVGDGKGGDTAVRHDSGYAIRAVGVHAGVGYDLLHDAPGMTPALLAKARGRFAAWIDWYEKDGYRAKSPGTNYQAGYLFAVTAIAIAQAGEAGPAGAKLWRHVVDDVWGTQMKRAAQPGGLLEGGDWGEGWQYGPLSVASYGLASRAMTEQGVALPEFQRWSDEIVLRHIHALVPGDRGLFVAGDTQNETPNITPNAWTLMGVIGGLASDKAAGWARAELDRLKLKTEDKSFLLYDVLAEARGVAPVPFPRETAPTLYLAKGTGALYARTSWSPNAVWMAVQCTRTIDVDHLPANAGNFVLARGTDDVVVDPSPYGTLSSLTSNAPTVESAHLPPDYKPSQAFWSEKTRYVWARQTESAVVAARCDYADQYKFQDRPSDVPFAMRDLVLIPSADANATLVVVDRARSGADARGLHLRFRTPFTLATGKDGAASGTNGRTAFTITPAYTTTTATAPTLKQTGPGNCFGASTKRGDCNAARFAVNDYGVVLKGAQALGLHVLDVGPVREQVSPPKAWSAPDHRAVSFERGKLRGVVVVGEPATATADKLIYRAEPGRHVVLDGPASPTGRVAAAAERDGSSCKVTLRPTREGGMDARPLAMTVSDTCEVKEDPPSTKAAALAGFVAGPGAGAAAGAAAATGGGGAVPAGDPHMKTGAEVFVPPPANTAQRVSNGSGSCACEAAGARGDAPGRGAALGALALGLVAFRRARRRAR